MSYQLLPAPTPVSSPAILQEVRVAQTGAQVMLGFLLTLAFSCELLLILADR